jgi:hypothetical protein
MPTRVGLEGGGAWASWMGKAWRPEGLVGNRREETWTQATCRRGRATRGGEPKTLAGAGLEHGPNGLGKAWTPEWWGRHVVPLDG